ncbi:MAG: FtsX-like permease family protein [Lachnospiraceae bacterium]|nr:FtsX-like permease family protein [Lachnospiraceae bacterium]
MRFSDILSMSLTNLWRRKIRTFLTVLGVIIGTASIVVMLSLGLGLKEAMLAQVSTAGGLTEITVTSEADYGEGELLLDDSTIEKFLEIDNVKSVEPQMSYTLSMITGKYEAEDVTIIGVTQDFLKKIDLEEGKIPETKTDGSLSLIFGNQVLGESFYESATGVYPYWEREELPDVDLLKAAIFGGIMKDEEAEEETETDTTPAVANDVDPAFADVENDFEGDFSDDTFSSDSFDSSSNSESSSLNDTEEPTTQSTDTTEQSGVPGFEGDAQNFDSFNTDSDYNGGSVTIFTSDVKRVPIKAVGITAAEESDYTDYSYNCYADMDTLKAFIHKNYSLNDIVPEQPVGKNGKPYKDLKYSQLTVNVDGSDNVEDVLETIQDMGYRGEANKEWLEEIEKEFMIIEAVLGGIGAVAMLVAAISIANTMTMSTYERTKEIGIMKVLGCSLGNIRSMFLSEAAFIGFLGGVAGCVLSFIISIILNRFLAPTIMEEYGYGENMNISVIPFWLVLLAIVFATVIGMVAGFFPAQRATKLSPLAAIRNE